MLVDQFWKLIFIAIFATGCWFWWKSASAKKQHKNEIAYLAELIDVSKENEPKSEAEAVERFFKSLAALEVISYRLEGKEGDKAFHAETILQQANDLNDGDPKVEDLVERSIAAAYKTAEVDLKLFQDDDARSRLEEGARPKIVSGPWAGQWAEAGYHIPPAIDDSVAKRLCNRTLVPESVKSVRAAGEVTASVQDWADRMKRAKLLDIVAHKRIIGEYNLLRKASDR